jgi:DHA1 family multidrug resistance protein-like MFS transporter
MSRGVANLQAAFALPWVRTVAILWLAQVASEIGFGFALPFTPLFVQELGVTDVGQAGLWAGVTAASFAVAMGVMAPVWGTLADRYGYRLMIQRGFFGAGLALGGIAFVQTPEQMLVLRIMHGILTGVYTGIATLISLTTPQQNLATVLGLMQSAIFIGVALGPLIGGAFADQFGLRAAFGATGAILIVTGVLVSLLVREPAREELHRPETPEAEETETGSWLRRRGLVAVVILTAISRLAIVAPNPILPLFVAQFSDSAEHLGATIGFILAATGIASTLSALLVGRLSDRYGRRGPLLICLLLSAALSPLHVIVGSIWQLVVLRTAVGLVQGGIGTALQAVLVDVTPGGRRGAAIGVLTTATAVGNGAGPVAGSAVAAVFGVSSAFLAMTPLYLAGAWLVGLLRPRTSDRPSPD